MTDQIEATEIAESYRALLGSWEGKGTGPQGPFDVNAEFEERGRWVLLRHEILPPDIDEPFYVSTQVFGTDDEGLSLDYFDTAGSFHFTGNQTDKGFAFSWKRTATSKAAVYDHWKKSTYDFDGPDTVRFNYQSAEHQKDGDVLIEFSGSMTRLR